MILRRPRVLVLLVHLALGAPAAALVAAKRDANAILLISPADHMIRETALFTRLIDNAADAAR